MESARTIWARAGDDVRVGDSYRCLSRLNWFTGRNDLAEEQASLAVATLAASGSIELAMAYSNVAQLRMLSSDTEGTRTWSARTLDLLAELPPSAKHTEVTVHALNNLGTSEMSGGDPVEGVRMLTGSLEQARAADLHEHAARAYCNLLSLAVTQRRHEDAEAMVEAGLEYCIDRDLDSWTHLPPRPACPAADGPGRLPSGRQGSAARCCGSSGSSPSSRSSRCWSWP